jgi:phosphomevalonate kinase
MNTRVVARAPGKLFVLGEYAVLDGCPAVVAAIDRAVEVSLELGSTGTTLRVNSAVASAGFSTTAPLTQVGPLRFAHAAFRSAVYTFPEIGRRNAVLTVASRLEDRRHTKLGLGSSAAVTASVVAAVFAAAGQDLRTESCRDHLFTVALDAHRCVQGSLGSGADVAASVYGGLLLFRPRDGIPQVTSIRLPSHARLLVAWTGEPASTPDLVQQYRSAQNGSAAQRAAFVQASRACVDDFVAGLGRGTVSLSAVLENGRLLERLAADLNLPLLTPSLRRLVSVARAEGAAAKISGAGGGDCGIAITCGDEAARRVRAAWRAAGLHPLDLSISDQGVSANVCQVDESCS